MTFEQFCQGDSLLHRADPCGKIISAAILSITLASCQHLVTAFAGLVIAFFLVLTARLSVAVVTQRLLLVNTFNALLWLLLPLTYAQPPFFQIAGWTFSRPGLELVALITVKSNGILLVFISLLATSTVAELGNGLQRLHLSPRLCMILLFSYRYITVLHGEYKRLQRAARLRCFTPGTNIHTYKSYGHLLGMLLVKSWNRAENVNNAMILRGFTGTFKTIRHHEMARNDYIILTGSLLVGLGLFFLDTTM